MYVIQTIVFNIYHIILNLARYCSTGLQCSYGGDAGVPHAFTVLSIGLECDTEQQKALLIVKQEYHNK